MDLSKQIKEVKDIGFTLIESVLSPDKCDHYVNLLEKHHQEFSAGYAHSENYTALADKSQERVVYNLHNKHVDWWDLFSHQTVISIIEPLLAEGSYQNAGQFYLNNISARAPNKGAGEQQVHIDCEIPGLQWPIIVNAVWYLNDSTVATGATRVVPGSHKRDSFCEDGVVPSDATIVEARAGDVLIFDGGLWHGGTESSADAARWALLLGYARWFVKPSFDYKMNTPDDIFDRVSEDQKKILGFNLFPPRDEFTRTRRRSDSNERPFGYSLPKIC